MESDFDAQGTLEVLKAYHCCGWIFQKLLIGKDLFCFFFYLKYVTTIKSLLSREKTLNFSNFS